MIELPDIVLLKLSIQRAMVGNVTSNLAAVCAKHCTEELICLTAYFFEGPTENDFDSMNSVTAQVVGDFPGDRKEELIIKNISEYSQSKEDLLIFLRYEAEEILNLL